MSDIPEDIQDTVQAIFERIAPDYFAPELFDAFEAAILAERERCANIAACYGGVWLVRLSAETRPAKFLRDKVQHKMETAEAIASLIRTHTEPQLNTVQP